MATRRKAQKPYKRPPEGSLAWVEWAVTQTEAALLAAEHDVGPLAELVRKLKTYAAWELVFTDEPRDWDRLVCERIDPRCRRTHWIDALATGYFLLRESGEKGRLTRRDAERAAGWSEGPWVGLKSAALASSAGAERSHDEAIIGKGASKEAIKEAVFEAVSQSAAIPPAVGRLPSNEGATPPPFELLKSFWEAAPPAERERFAVWAAEQQASR